MVGVIQYDEACAIDWDKRKPEDVVRHFKVEMVTQEEAAAGWDNAPITSEASSCADTGRADMQRVHRSFCKKRRLA